MTFKGYLVKNKTKNIVFPISLLADSGYKSTPDTISDDDSYVDGTGKLHRSVLPHTRSKIWLKTEQLTAREKEVVQEVFPNRVMETLEYWNDATNSYKTGNFYIPDIDWVIFRVDPVTFDRMYDAVEIKLVEY